MQKVILEVFPKSDEDDMACHCENEACVQTLAAVSTQKSMLYLQEKQELKVIVTSGFRCQIHNAAVGGKKDSKHLLGLAVDIWTPDLDQLEINAKLYFDVVIRYKGFLHCHNEE